MASILISGFVVLVDDEDVALVNKYRWSVYRDKYPIILHRSGPHSNRLVIQLPRLLMDAPKGMEVDHINGDRLDNRRSNLRVCSHAENMRNRKRRVDNRSGYKGVYWDPARSSWRAEIRHNKRVYWLGRFDSVKDAARAYDEAAERLHGEFACLNFPKPFHRAA